jgi:hypothetical protein
MLKTRHDDSSWEMHMAPGYSKDESEFKNGLMWEEVLVRKIDRGVQDFLADFKQEANWQRKRKGIAIIRCPGSGNMAAVIVPGHLIGKRVNIEISYLPEGTSEVARLFRTDIGSAERGPAARGCAATEDPSQGRHGPRP